MEIKANLHVDVQGRVYLPFLTDWKYPRSDLYGLIQVLCLIFSEQPPVFARSRPTPQAGHPPGGQRFPYPSRPPYPSTSLSRGFYQSGPFQTPNLGVHQGAELNTTKLRNITLTDMKVQCNLFRQKNTERHRTNEYQNNSLVLRRGDEFFVGMKFEGIQFSDIMNIKLCFNMECKHLVSKKITIASIGIDEVDEESWSMTAVKKDDENSSVVVKVMIPVSAVIGRYKVDVVLPTSSSVIILNELGIIVIFNPWNKDDEVFLEDEMLRQEYVLSDTGLIYRGSARHGVGGITALTWDFGQFDEDVLNCVLVLLQKDKRLESQPVKSHRKHNSASWIGRVLSAVLNCQDELGLLEGNWSGKYDDGKAPSTWFGSADIYQEYYKSNRPVKYGQCWVFSGVMTTALRALGIPARCVTNFDSAHDTDESMTIDILESEDGSAMDDIPEDSIWNFHVWNEMWTKRKDLPSNKFDGWNVLDATPQEKSRQMFQLGPAPVSAIKSGDIYIQHDTGFVFAEVNADVVTWIVSRDANATVVFKEAKKRDKAYVGKYISTKMVGQDRREDITSLYKHPEGSREERAAFMNAYNFGQGPKLRKGLLNEEEGDDFEIDLTMNPGTLIPIGSDLTCTVEAKNISRRNLTINITTIVSTVEYTGRTKAVVKRQKWKNIHVKAGKNVQQDIVVSAKEYVKKLSDLNFMKIVAIVKVLETKKQFIEDCKIQLYHDDCIEIEFLDQVKVGVPTLVEITFTNKMNLSLSNLIYSVNGRGLTGTIRQQRGNLKEGQNGTVWFRFTPFKAGKHKLHVDIDSAEVKDLRSSVEVEVR